MVKANGYGHGAAACAAAALRGGATRLAVAAASEADELRLHFPECPDPGDGRADRATSSRTALAAAGGGGDLAGGLQGALLARRRGARPAGGACTSSSTAGWAGSASATPTALIELARACAADRRTSSWPGVWTHFATADEPDDELPRRAAGGLPPGRRGRARDRPGCTVHAANSAATLRDPATHFDMVRCGIAIYGLDPFHRDPADHGLEPALELHSYVADVKRFERGASAGYGRTWRAPEDTWVGVLPIGYGDGVRRGLSNNAEVLVGGRRYPLVGTVSMDNVTIDLGPDTRRRARRARRPDRPAGLGADPRRGDGRLGSRRSTTRSPAGSPSGCRGSSAE